MGLALVYIYIAMNLLSPADLFPALNPFHPLLILAFMTIPLAMLARLGSPEIGKLRVQTALVTLFFAWACVSWLPHGWLGGNVKTLLELAPNLIAYYLGIIYFRTPGRLQALRAVLVFVAIWVIVSAFLEIPFVKATGVSSPYAMADMSLNQIGVRIRGLGTLHDPNVFGQFLLMIVPMLYVSKHKHGLGLGYALAIPITLLFCVAIYYTNSRGTAMGFAVLIGLYLTRKLKTAGAVGSAVIGGMILVVVNATRGRSISMTGGMDRLAIWSEGMAYFKSSPIWGIGIRAFADREGLTAHNTYLLCASELGLVGYFFWMSMVVVTIFQLNMLPKVVGDTNPALVRWAAAIKISLGVYLFTSFFLSRAYELPLFLLLGTAGGIVVAAGGDDTMPLRGSWWPLWSFVICVTLLTLIYLMLRLRAV